MSSERLKMRMQNELRREHLRHMTDGRWHDDCRYCLKRRRLGGTGLELDPDDIADIPSWWPKNLPPRGRS